MTQKMPQPRKYHAQPRLTEEFKRSLERNIKMLFVNRDFIDFIKQTIKKLPVRDKLATLYFFKKLAVQTIRKPDPDFYKRFKDEIDEYLSVIADEQKQLNPEKWINAEIEYLLNTAEKLTVDDVNYRLDIMQEAKQKLTKDILTSNEVMQIFNISKSTLNRWRSNGLNFHKQGKFIYFEKSDLESFLKKEAA